MSKGFYKLFLQQPKKDQAVVYFISWYNFTNVQICFILRTVWRYFTNLYFNRFRLRIFFISHRYFHKLKVKLDVLKSYFYPFSFISDSFKKFVNFSLFIAVENILQ